MKCLKSIKLTKDSDIYNFMIKKFRKKLKKITKIASLNKFLYIYYARVMEI